MYEVWDELIDFLVGTFESYEEAVAGMDIYLDENPDAHEFDMYIEEV